MSAWRTTVLLSLFSAGVLAAEPANSPEAELSLELLEFLGEYGNSNGELELPDDFDDTLAEPDSTASEPDQTPPNPATNGNKPAAQPARVNNNAVENSR